MSDSVKTFKKNNEKGRSIKVIVTDKDFTERAVLSESRNPNDANLYYCRDRGESKSKRMSKQKKEDDEKAYDMGGEARKLSDITLLLQHPLSHGICAPVFDKIAIVTASDDLPTLQRRQKQAQTEAYSAVLDKATVVGCLKEVNDYVSRANLPYDDDDTDRIVISMKLKGWGQKAMVLTATQVITMGLFTKLAKC
ncbi:hypothetical protein PC114_g9536 [Phytophthora cactorum]|nr:hypothetical protein PC114_g9536 [Phytophthora cactorum]